MARRNRKRAYRHDPLKRIDYAKPMEERRVTQRQLDYLRALWKARYPDERCPRPTDRLQASNWIDALRRGDSKPQV